MIGKVDVAFISAFKGDDRDENLRNSEQLSESLRSVGFGFFRFLGHYESRNRETLARTYGGDEQSFGVFNNKESSALSFFQVIISLGRRYRQDSVMLIPAGDTKFNRVVLKAGHGYWFYVGGKKDGLIEDKGILDEAGVEEWSYYNATDDATGYTRTSGTGDKLVFKGGDNKARDIWADYSYDFSGSSCLLTPSFARHVSDYRDRIIKSGGFVGVRG
jgi:hypothetical protein